MAQSKIESYQHFIWTTKGREPLITPEIERRLHRCITSLAEEAGCVVHAIDGIPDHVHLVVKFPGTLTYAKLMQRVKGVSSAFANDLFRHQKLFRWQDGYAAYSVTPSHLKVVVAYVQNQKQHHADETTLPEWEETAEDDAE